MPLRRGLARDVVAVRSGAAPFWPRRRDAWRFLSSAFAVGAVVPDLELLAGKGRAQFTTWAASTLRTRHRPRLARPWPVPGIR